MGIVRVAAAQMKVTEDIDKNLNKILNFIDKAASKKAKIVCFPEVCLDCDESKRININPYIRKIQEKCKNKRIYCVVGSYVKESKKIFNSVFLIDNKGKIKYEYRKMHLWRDEKKRVTPGRRNRVIDTDFGKIAVIDCWDIAFSQLVKKLSGEGAKIIFCPVFEVDYSGDWRVTPQIPQVRAYENMVYFVICDAFSPRTLSQSGIFSPLKILAKIRKKEGIIFADLDMKKLAKWRRYYDCWK
ncbi:MAG: carbon-nitrogen hydrolase family protein [Candidatus Micrarchaeota archaeon]